MRERFRFSEGDEVPEWVLRLSTGSARFLCDVLVERSSDGVTVWPERDTTSRAVVHIDGPVGTPMEVRGAPTCWHSMPEWMHAMRFGVTA